MPSCVVGETNHFRRDNWITEARQSGIRNQTKEKDTTEGAHKCKKRVQER